MQKTIPCKQWIKTKDIQKKVTLLQKFAPVMSDPNKFKTLLLLDQYNRSSDDTYEKLHVTDLAEHLEMSVSAISHSLRFLEDRGFVKKEKQGRSVRYSLTKQGRQLVINSDYLILIKTPLDQTP